MTNNPSLNTILDHCRKIIGPESGTDPIQYAMEQKFIDAQGQFTALGKKLLHVLTHSSEVDI